ncbi:hypothetical protein BDB00DRAFT_325554 [Zychaea mexicana]|uniref:uncharacterized protein n=1 Tax=Zychaea mexicana TaxID=64656 RepID=UPI0022FEA60F|nr:uncharacterized protein BDB00DRAFT_325554 [Zychaea mexicana]KAI9498911.1 hypothetical protein BDB00DRAFT_325554 [Zychaea mexicana]
MILISNNRVPSFICCCCCFLLHTYVKFQWIKHVGVPSDGSLEKARSIGILQYWTKDNNNQQMDLFSTPGLCSR